MSAEVQKFNNSEQGIKPILRNNWFTPCLLAFGLATIVMMPIFGHGLPPISDIFAHYRWSDGFIDALREGAIYPRWLSTLNYGMGGPSTNYYPPLPFFVVAAFYLITMNTLKAMAFSCWLALALSGLAMYIFARSSLSRRASLLAAALYILAPYHVLDLYHRAALAEFWAFIWVPLILYATRRVATGEGWGAVALLAISFSLLLLTHVLTSFATALFLPIYVIFITRNKRKIAKIAAGLALGAGLSAIFLAPLILESDYVRLKFGLNKYSRFFLIENLPLALKSDSRQPDDLPRLFYQAPDYYFFEATVIILIPLFALTAFFIWKRWRDARQNAPQFAHLRAVCVVTLFGLLMTTRLSHPLWLALPGLPYMQFPFRWLLVASAGISFLSAAVCSAMTQQRQWRNAYGAAIALLIALNFVLTIYIIVRQPRGEQAIPQKASNMDVREYRPRWWDFENYHEQGSAPVTVNGGEAEVQVIDGTGARQSYRVAASAESRLVFRTLYFPGWVGRVDGSAVEISPSEQGNIQCLVEPGDHQLTLSFEDTWPRAAGKLISAVCFIIAVAMLYRARRAKGVAAEFDESGRLAEP
jgi:uncharacterized membrane protein YfhO